MKLIFLIGLSVLSISVASCNKDDDQADDSTVPTVERKVSATFTLNGQTKSFDNGIAQYTENPQYLDLTASSGVKTLQLEFSSVPGVGAYTSSTTIDLELVLMKMSGSAITDAPLW